MTSVKEKIARKTHVRKASPRADSGYRKMKTAPSSEEAERTGR